MTTDPLVQADVVNDIQDILGPPSSTTSPGGTWISPDDRQSFSNPIQLAAHAYDYAGTGVEHVNFTALYNGSWHTICQQYAPSHDDIYDCPWDFSGVPFGNVEVSFDVYDKAGNSILAPDGTRTISYSSSSAIPTSTPGSTSQSLSFISASPHGDNESSGSTFHPNVVVQTNGFSLDCSRDSLVNSDGNRYGASANQGCTSLGNNQYQFYFNDGMQAPPNPGTYHSHWYVHQYPNDIGDVDLYFTVPAPPSEGLQVCSGTNYSGSCDVFTSSDPNACIFLGREAGHNQSLRWLGSYKDDYHVTFYHDTSCNVSQSEHFSGDGDRPDIGSGLYNQFYAVKINRYTQNGLQVCSGTGYGGDCEVFASNDPNACINLDRVAGHNQSLSWLGSYAANYHVTFYHDTSCNVSQSEYFSGDGNRPDIGSGLYNQFYAVKINRYGLNGLQVCSGTSYGGDCEIFSSSDPNACISLDRVAGRNQSFSWLGDYSDHYHITFYHDTSCNVSQSEYFSGDGNRPDIGSGLYNQFYAVEINRYTPSCSAGQYTAEYYSNRTLSGNWNFADCETSINYNWQGTGPGHGLTTDNFSVRWIGDFSFTAGTYSFHGSVDDGIRLWVDGNLIVDEWQDPQVTSYQASTYLSAGQHEIKAEYYQASGSAQIQVVWNSVQSPVPISPSDGATLNQGDPTTLSWSQSGEDYDVEVATDPGFSNLVAYRRWGDSSTSWNFSSPPSYLDAGTYYWRVKTKVSSVESDWSATQVFTVRGITLVGAWPQHATELPGTSFHPSIVLRTFGLSLNCTQDALQNYGGNLYGTTPSQACTDLGNNEYQFYFSTPMTAPSSPGTYFSNWRIWYSSGTQQEEIVGLGFIVPSTTTTGGVSCTTGVSCVIDSSGPLSHIVIGADTTLQVINATSDPTHGEIYPPDAGLGNMASCSADSGVWVNTSGMLYGPNFSDSAIHCAGSATSSIHPDNTYTPVSQTSSGTGTGNDPYTVVTTVSLTNSLSLIQTITYVIGNQYIQQSLSLVSPTALTAHIYHGTDIYLHGGDSGFGYYDPSSGTIGGRNVVDGGNSQIACSTSAVPGAYSVLAIPGTPAQHYDERNYSAIWSDINTSKGGTSLPDIVDTSVCEDNAMALEWDNVTAGPGGNGAVSDTFSFSPAGPLIPDTITPTPSSMPTNTSAPTSTPTPNSTPTTTFVSTTPTPTMIATPVATGSAVPTLPNTATATPTNTAVPPSPTVTNTSPFIPSSTNTVQPTDTSTPIPTTTTPPVVVTATQAVPTEQPKLPTSTSTTVPTAIPPTPTTPPNPTVPSSAPTTALLAPAATNTSLPTATMVLPTATTEAAQPPSNAIPTATPSVVTDTSGGTAAPPPPTHPHSRPPTTHTTSLPLSISRVPQRIVSGSTTTIQINTVPHAQITTVVQVMVQHVTFTGAGTHRHRHVQTQTLYRATSHAAADKHGRLTWKLHVTYNPAKPMPARLTITASMKGRTRTSWTMTITLTTKQHKR